MLANGTYESYAQGSDEEGGEGPAADGLAARKPCWKRLLGIFALQRWKYPTAAEARLLSWMSILLTILTSLLGLSFAIVGDSASMLAFSLEGMIDIASSVVILWRFKGSIADEARMAQREKRASAAIGLSFIVLGIIVCLTAIVHLGTKSAVEDTAALLGITIPSSALLLGLGALKLHVSLVLRSNALFEDGVCSVGAGLLSVGIFSGIFVYRANPSVWWLDSVFALFISLGILAYGVLIVRKVPVCSRAFWLHDGEEDEEGEDGTDGARSGSFDHGIDLKPVDMDMI